MMIAAGAVVLALALGAADDSRTTQTVVASAPLAAGGEVEIDDEYGDIDVSRGGPGSVKITAVKHSPNGSDLASIDVHVDAVEGAVKISTTFRGVSWFSHHEDSVNYDVRVPSGTKLIVRGKYGDVSVSDVGGLVDASTQYGNVEAEGAVRSASLDTEYGDATLSVTAIEPSDTITMRTTYGDVDLTLPAGTEPRVHAKTLFGDVKNDFDSSPNGPVVDLHTTFGDVDVRKG